MQPSSRSLQLWPSGRSLTVSGEYPKFRIHEGKMSRRATADETRDIQASELAAMYVDRYVWCCDSSLVDQLMKSEMEGFQPDDMENVYIDPSDWTLEECRDYLRDSGADTSELPEPSEDDADDEWCLEQWREAAQEYADENPQEAYEWHRVDPWLCARLRELGEIIIDNGFGCWWGRGCTGQSMLMDGTLQKVARGVL